MKFCTIMGSCVEKIKRKSKLFLIKWRKRNSIRFERGVISFVVSNFTGLVCVFVNGSVIQDED